MCQFNLYFIDKNISQNKIDELMLKYFGGKSSEILKEDKEQLKNVDFKKYNGYFCVPNMCNCGSIQCYWESKAERIPVKKAIKKEREGQIKEIIKCESILKSNNKKELSRVLSSDNFSLKLKLSWCLNGNTSIQKLKDELESRLDKPDVEEYQNLKSFIDDILSLSDDVLLYSYFSSPSNKNATIEIDQKELTIEDIVYLKYDTLLIVKK